MARRPSGASCANGAPFFPLVLFLFSLLAGCAGPTDDGLVGKDSEPAHDHGSHDHSDDAGATAGNASEERAVWRVTEAVLCRDDTLEVTTDIVIENGGVLDLQGCRLRFVVPPYENERSTPRREGLRFDVLPGGMLRLSATPAFPSIIESTDRAYGYTMRVYGGLVSDGLPGQMNRISHLEGAMLEVFLYSGLQVYGEAWVNHTLFYDNTGPPLYAVQGGRVVARDLAINVSYGGLAAIDATLDVARATIKASVEGIRVSRSDVRLEAVHVDATRQALHAALSNVTITASTLKGHGAVSFEGGQVTVDDSTLRYVEAGAAHVLRGKPSPPPGSRGLLLRDVRLENVGHRSNAMAVHVEQVPLRIERSSILNATGYAIQALQAPDVTVTAVAFSGSGRSDLLMVNPGRFTLEANTHSQIEHPVLLSGKLKVTVLQATGEPAPGAFVQSGEASGMTDENGTAQFQWTYALANGTSPPVDAISVHAAWGTKATNADLPFGTTAAELRLPTSRTDAPQWSIGLVVLGVGLLALVGLAVRRRARQR